MKKVEKAQVVAVDTTNWKAVTFTAHRRDWILQDFKASISTPAKALDLERRALVEGFYQSYVLELPTPVQEEIKRVEAGLMAYTGDNPPLTFLSSHTYFSVQVKFGKGGDRLIESLEFSAARHGAEDRGIWLGGQMKVRPNSNHATPGISLTVKDTDPRYKAYAAISDKLKASGDEINQACKEFGILLGSCRTAANLKAKWPEAVKYIPQDWLVLSMKGQEVAPINVTALADIVHKLEKAA